MSLEIRELSATAGASTLVHRASLSLVPGELVALIGPNGAGKSSLLRAVIGSIEPKGGEVLLDGEPLVTMTRAVRSRRLSYLPQERLVEWDLPVRDVVRLSVTGTGAVAQAAVALKAVGAERLSARSAKSLSGGELARVLLARALAVGAPYLLADEPIAGLDPFHQISVMERLQQEARGGTGVLCVLHDLALAARFADRVVMMREGRVIADGPPSQTLTPERIAEVYGVSPAIGEAKGAPVILPWSTDAQEPYAPITAGKAST